MTAQAGYDMLLKVGDGGEPEVFSTVGGLRNTGFTFRARVKEADRVNADGWREILENAGERSLTIAATGIFTDSAAEAQVRAAAFSNTLLRCEIHSGNGQYMTGMFKIAQYGRFGDHDKAETYQLTLESSGPVNFIVP